MTLVLSKQLLGSSSTSYVLLIVAVNRSLESQHYDVMEYLWQSQ